MEQTPTPKRRSFRWLIKLMNFDEPIRFFQQLLLVLTGILVALDISVYPLATNFVQNLIIEAHGIIPDLLIFGILMTVYERWREKVTVHKESLETYMGQNTPEATEAIIRIVKEMNKLDASRFHLSECTLAQQDLRHCDFTGSSLHRVNFEAADLTLAELDKCRMRDVNFANAVLRSVTFYGSDLDKIDFSGAKLNDVNFQKADLRFVDFSNADLRFWKHAPEFIENINLEGAIVEYKNWIKRRLVDQDVMGWRQVTDTFEVDATPYTDERGTYYIIKRRAGTS